MKQLLYLLAFCLCGIAAYSQTESVYNQPLADSLGADEYGMKMYTLVMLKTGANTGSDKSVRDSAFRGHLDNINRLAKAGKLVVAGPLVKNDKAYRGIFILNAKTVEEANQLLATDPAVQQKYLDAELYQWYGSAALPMYLPYHDKVEKKRP
ncbi:YciI family protein [Foetidibacter luteolus]|uniref:YciI family protein n=1 Tax=Foetidibacter luteolus TaxID=2608880 RepID=UPI00129B8511|nr:YciI family protein [Foetidibacter luteolus]